MLITKPSLSEIITFVLACVGLVVLGIAHPTLFSLGSNSQLFGACLTGITVPLLFAMDRFRWRSDALSAGLWSGGIVLSAAMAVYLTGDFDGLLIPVGASVLFGVAARAYMRRLYTDFGVGVLVSNFVTCLTALIFSQHLASELNWPLPVSVGLHAFQVISFAVALIVTLLPSPISELCMRFPKRDAALKLISAPRNQSGPTVSIHVPCYAEPPDMVIGTLNAIAKLTYSDFEVLVIDNNTKDPNLWQPVEAHCKRLGERFRFFHVAPLAGAKAGALNLALRHSAANAELIALIDADYVAQPDFLDRFTPLFDDSRVGYVQTSHDYYNMADSPIHGGAYSVYLPFHKQVLPAMNEYDAAFTVGTMCIFRRAAIERAGGWSEWCLTEDSEIAVRIQALGYIGHVFADTSGRGLMPGTMDSFKKQWFRWFCGPIQQLVLHWRLLLGFGQSSRLTFAQRILELDHSLRQCVRLFSDLLLVLALFLAADAAFEHRLLQISLGMKICLASAALSQLFSKWIVVKQVLGRAPRAKDVGLFVLADEALSLVRCRAVFSVLFGRKPAWHRTDKFNQTYSVRRAFESSKYETLLALGCVGIGVVLAKLGDFGRFDFAALLSCAYFLRGLRYSSTFATAMAFEAGLRSKPTETYPSATSPAWSLTAVSQSSG